MVTKWLITGGCGFIGRNLIKHLMEEGGHFIRVVDNLKVGTRDDLSMVCDWRETLPENLRPPGAAAHHVELIVEDILNPSLALKACSGMDMVVHLAANTGVSPSVLDPRMDCEVNVTGTLNYLEAARRNHIKRFIFASSGAPVGEATPPIHEETAPHPVSPYGASKLAGEGYCSAYFRTFGVQTVALRFGNVYGPLSGKKDSVIAKFIKQVLAGESVEIWGDGTQTRDFIHVNDLIKAIRRAVSIQGAGGETFQIATNREHTVNEVADFLKTEMKVQCDMDMAMTYGEPRKGDVKRNYSDTSKAKRILGWQSDIHLAAGITKTVRWFKEHNGRKAPSSGCPPLP